MFPRLFSKALQVHRNSSREVDLDPAEEADQCWHKVNGKRAQRTREFFGNNENVIKVIILALIMEPLRWLCSLWLKNSREVVDPTRPPLLCDMVVNHFSPLTVVLQYLSTLLRGGGGRIRLWCTCAVVRVLRICVVASLGSSGNFALQSAWLLHGSTDVICMS